MTDRSFEHANDLSRERLAGLILTLDPTRLAIDLGEGWTVASALAHTGFWDRWQAARWTEMLAGRWTADEEAVLAAAGPAVEAFFQLSDDVPKIRDRSLVGLQHVNPLDRVP